MTLDALSHGLTALVASHGGLVAACSAVSVVLGVSKDARALVAGAGSVVRHIAGRGVLFLVREQVVARNAQHDAVMAKLEVVDALALEVPVINRQLEEAAEDRKLFRGAVVALAESRVELGGLVKAVDKLTDKLDDFCDDTRDHQADHGERLSALEAERRTVQRRRVDRTIVSPTEG